MPSVSAAKQDVGARALEYTVIFSTAETAAAGVVAQQLAQKWFSIDGAAGLAEYRVELRVLADNFQSRAT